MQIQLLSLFSRYSCDGGATVVSVTSLQTLTSSLVSTTTSKKFGMLCLTKGQYKVTIWFPAGSAGAQSDRATIFILSVRFYAQFFFSRTLSNICDEIFLGGSLHKK